MVIIKNAGRGSKKVEVHLIVEKLKLLSKDFYPAVEEEDPIRFYYLPIFGPLYRKRVEMCLSMCKGGERVLDIGFGSGVNFLNLGEKYVDIYGLDLTAKVENVERAFAPVGLSLNLQNGNVTEMPYQDAFFDTVLLISILEHLKAHELMQAIDEIYRVLKPGGQMVYGVPVESPFMVRMFRMLGYDIRGYHFSTEQDVLKAAGSKLERVEVQSLRNPIPFLEPLYQVGHFVKR